MAYKKEESGDILLSTITKNIGYSGYELVDKYGGALYKFCRSLAYSKEDAEDLFQETFIKVFEKEGKMKLSDNPQGFLFAIASYTWKSQKRRHARRSRIAPVEALSENIGDDVSIEESIIEKEEANTIRSLVNALPEKFKLPIVLYYTLEMSTSDIASALKLPPGTVKSRLFKARQFIKKGLDHYEQQQH